MRGVALLAALTYLLYDPIEQQADVVSAILAFGLLALLLLNFSAVLLHGYLLRRRLTVAAYPPSPPVVTGQSARIGLTLGPIRVLPGCRLDISLICARAGAPVPAVSITGMSPVAHSTYADIIFPHRGGWDFTGAQCELIDALGVVNVRWLIPISLVVNVSPVRTEDARLPILSSTQRAGDLILDTDNRNGDPYDIKPYHPSDGIKKIIWKTFAKRGELLSRHPEASMTPEGHVVIAILAETADDEICSHALAYIRNLDQMALELLVGCLGRGSRPLAMDTTSSELLLIDSVWDANSLTLERMQSELTALLDECEALSQNLHISKLLLFCDGKHAATAHSQTLFATATWLESKGIEPVFCLTQPPQLPASNSQRTGLTRMRSLIINEPSHATLKFNRLTYESFLTECLRKKWEVHV